MQFTKQDLTQCENLTKAIKKGNFTLDGMEILAMSDCIKWLGKLYNQMQQELEISIKISEEPKEDKKSKKKV